MKAETLGVALESYCVLFVWAAPNVPLMGKLANPRKGGSDPRPGITLGYPSLSGAPESPLPWEAHGRLGHYLRYCVRSNARRIKHPRGG